MPRRRRLAILAAVTFGHLLVLGALEFSSRIDADVEQTVTTLVFLAPPPPLPESVALPPPAPSPPTEAAEPRPMPPPQPDSPPVADAPDPATPRDRPMVAVAPAPRADAPLRLFDRDGRVDLPSDVVARLEDVTSDTRTFDFQRPGLMESGTFMDRQPALVYEPTAFDGYWKPNQSVLTELLEAAVEKTTKSIEIPIPGSPGSKIVCTVSVLAMGGGCGIVNNNDGYVPQLDDPETLSPEEDKQCKAWWEQIVASTGQDTWRQTRELYEFSCRKPLEKATDPP
jgi:hypothetical protein